MTVHLTPRQTEIVELVRRGLSYREIGKQLGMSPRTARCHVEHIDRKITVDGPTPYKRVMRWMLEKAA